MSTKRTTGEVGMADEQWWCANDECSNFQGPLTPGPHQPSCPVCNHVGASGVPPRPLRRHRAPKWLAKRCRGYLESIHWIPGEDLRSPYAMVQATAALVAGMEGNSYRSSASWIDHAGNLPGPSWDEDVFVAEPYRTAFYPDGEEQLKAFVRALGVGYTVTEPGDWHPDTVRIAIYNDVLKVVKLGLETPRKEQEMAGAYEATVQVYKNEGGISLVTDATTLDAFNASIAKVDVSGFSEYETGKWYEQVEEVACKLKGYKSEVTERRLLIAGQSMPPAIDMVFSTGPGLPSVEVPSNGQAASV